MEGSTRAYIIGPPEAYHVGSANSGVVKKTLKRSAHVIMPLSRIIIMSHLRRRRGSENEPCAYSEAARKVRIRPIFSDIGIRSFRRIGHGSTSIATSVIKLGM